MDSRIGQVVPAGPAGRNSWLVGDEAELTVVEHGEPA